MALSKEQLISTAKKVAGQNLGKLPEKVAMAAARSVGDYEVDGYSLDPHIRLAMQASAGDQPLHEMDIVAARKTASEGFAASNAPRVSNVWTSETIIEDPVYGDLNARVYEPEEPDHLEKQSSALRPGVLFLHQGGLVLGDLDTCDTFCTQLAAGLDAVVISLEYLLAPEHLFPTQSANVDAAWAWLLDSASYLGIDTDQLVVCGDSAGGQLAALLCQRLRDANQPVPAVQALIYPFVDGAATSGSMESCADGFPLNIEIARYFLGQSVATDFDRTDPSYSPAQNENIGNVPPAVVISAAFDILRDQGVAFGEALEAAGVPTITRVEATLPHSFLAMGALSPVAYAAGERVVADIATMLVNVSLP